MTTWGGTTKLTPFAKTDNKPQDRNLTSGVQRNPRNNLTDNFPFMTPPAPDCTCQEPGKTQSVAIARYNRAIPRR
jgi:hypothetical protein